MSEDKEGEEYEGEEMDEEGRKLKNTKRRRPISAHADRPVLGTFMAAEILNAVLSENVLGPSASTPGYLQRQRGMLLECHAGIPEKVKLYDLRFSLLRRKDVTFVPPANALGPGDFDRSLDVDDDELAILDIDNLELTKKGSDASKEAGAEGGAQHHAPAEVATAVEESEASMHVLLDILNPN